MRRALRIGARIAAWTVVVVIAVVALALGAGAITARTEWGHRRLLATVLPMLEERLQGTLAIGGLDGDLVTGLVLRDIEIKDREGQAAIRIRRLTVGYNLLPLVRSTLRINHATIDSLWVRGRYFADGVLNLQTLLKPTPSTPPSPHPFKIDVGDLQADATLQYEPPPTATGPLGQVVLAGLRVGAAAHIEGERIDVKIAGLSVSTERPLQASLEVSGAAHLNGDAVVLSGVHATVNALGEELDKLAPDAALHGPFQIDLLADGPLGAIEVKTVLRPPQGTIDVEAQVGIGAAISWLGRVRIDGVDPGAATDCAPHGRIDLIADGQGRGGEGIVHLTSLEADALDAHISAHGQSDLRGFGGGALSLTAADLTRLDAWGLRGLAGAVDARATVERTTEHLSLDAAVNGTQLKRAAISLGRLKVVVKSVDLIGEARIEGLDLRAASRRFSTVHLAAHSALRAVAVHADAHGPGRFAFGLDVGGTPRWDGRLLAGVDALLKRLDLARGDVHWRNQGAARLEVDLSSFVDLRRLLLVSGSERMALDARYDWRQKTLAAYLTAKQVDVARLISLAGSAPSMPATRLDAEVRATGPIAALVAKASVAAVATYKDKAPVTLLAEARYARQRVNGQFVLSQEKAAVHGKFDLPTLLAASDPISLDVSLETVEFEKLASLLPTRLADLTGALTAHVHLGGTVGAPALETRVHAETWQFGRVELDGKVVSNDTTLSVDYGSGSLRMQQATKFGGGAGDLAFDAQLPINARDLIAHPRHELLRLARTAPVAVSITARGLDLARLPFESLGVANPVSTGMIDCSLKLAGALVNPAVHATVGAKNVSKDSVVDKVDAAVALELLEGRASLTASVDLRGQRLIDATGETRIDLAGVLAGHPWRTAAVRLAASIPSYDLARLRGMQPQLDKVAGTLVAQIDTVGDFAHQVSKGTLSVGGLRLGETQFNRLALTGDFDGETAHATADAEQKEGGQLHFKGTIPKSGAAPWQLAMKAQAFDLAFLAGAVSTLRTAAGRLDSTLDVTGTRTKPLFEAKAKVSDGAFQLRVDPHRYEKIQLDVAEHAGVVQLNNLSVASGDGTLKASGDAALVGLSPTRIDIKAVAHKFALVFGTVAAWLDADIGVHAEGLPQHLKVSVDLQRGLVRLPQLASTRKLQSIGEPARVTFTDKQALIDKAAHVEATDGEGSEATVRLRIPGPFYLRSKEANAELKGNLELVVRNSEVKLTGSAETSAGWLDLMGQRYNIEHARVAFSGDPVDPEVEVRITRQLKEAMLVIGVHGSGIKPTLDLSSDPPIYDKSEMLGIILSGDPSGQRVSDRGLDQKVVGAVSGMVLGKLKDTLAPSLPIDLIHVQTGSDGYTGLAQTRVEVGKFITDKLYVSYVHQFGGSSPSSVSNSNEAHVEYRFRPEYEVDTTFGDAGTGGVDVYWTHRY